MNNLEMAINRSELRSINQTVFDEYMGDVNLCRSEIGYVRAHDGSPGAALRCTTLDLRCDMLEIKLRGLLDSDYDMTGFT